MERAAGEDEAGCGAGTLRSGWPAFTGGGWWGGGKDSRLSGEGPGSLLEENEKGPLSHYTFHLPRRRDLCDGGPRRPPETAKEEGSWVNTWPAGKGKFPEVGREWALRGTSSQLGPKGEQGLPRGETPTDTR